MLRRVCGGKEEEMKRIVREDVGMNPETEEEKTLLAEATVLQPAPFTSVNMCVLCAGVCLCCGCVWGCCRVR